MEASPTRTIRPEIACMAMLWAWNRALAGPVLRCAPTTSRRATAHASPVPSTDAM